MKTKIFVLISVFFVTVFVFSFNIVKAGAMTDVITGGDKFLDSKKIDRATNINYDELKSTSKDLYNMLLVIGIVVAVIIEAVLGIKFMIGSVEEKAQVKDSLVPFIIGCIIIFGAFGLWSIFVNAGNEFDRLKQQTTANTVNAGTGSGSN